MASVGEISASVGRLYLSATVVCQPRLLFMAFGRQSGHTGIFHESNPFLASLAIFVRKRSTFLMDNLAFSNEPFSVSSGLGPACKII